MEHGDIDTKVNGAFSIIRSYLEKKQRIEHSRKHLDFPDNSNDKIFSVEDSWRSEETFNHSEVNEKSDGVKSPM